MKVSNILIFVAGATSGSLATFIFLNQKFNKDLEKEVSAYKEMVANFAGNNNYNEENNSQNEAKNDENNNYIFEKNEKQEENSLKKETETIITNHNYSQYSLPKVDEPIEKKSLLLDNPRVISEDEFASSDYEVVTLTYYGDGVVTNDEDDPLQCAIDIIGEDAMQVLGDNMQDVVYVRNDETQKDYEIIADGRDYPDAI